MSKSGSKGSGGGSHGVSVVGNIRSHDSRFPCPSGGEGRYSNHDICLKGRVYSDKGRADGCYDRTDKFCSTDRSNATETVKGQSSAGSCPSAHSNSRGGEGRNRNSGSSDNHHESNRGGSVTQTTFVGMVLSEASKYGLNTGDYQSQVNTMSWDDLSKQYQNWKVLEKQIMVGKVLSEADKYGLNNSFYQQQVNTMSDAELSKQYQEWKALEKRILVGKVLSQYSEATGKSIDEIDEQTKRDLNNADQASLEKIYNDNIKNKQVVLAGTILSQLNEISGKPLNELDQEMIDFVNNSELATLQLIYNTNVNQKQLLENGTVGLYELYFRLPVNVSYKILYNPGHFNSDMNKLLTRQLDLKNISNLNLSNNQIGDEGAKLLADSLAKGQMPKLKVLHLHGNKITDEGTKLFIKALESPNVTEVSIILRIANKADEVKDFVVETIGEIKDFITKGLNYAVEQHSQKQWEINKIRTNVEGEKWRDCKDTAINFGMGLASGGIKCAPLVEMPIAMGVCIVKDAGIGLLQPETLGCIADINDFFGD